MNILKTLGAVAAAYALAGCAVLPGPVYGTGYVETSPGYYGYGPGYYGSGVYGGGVYGSGYYGAPPVAYPRSYYGRPGYAPGYRSGREYAPGPSHFNGGPRGGSLPPRSLPPRSAGPGFGGRPGR